LQLDNPSTFSGEIFNFTGNGSLSGSDQIDLKDIDYNSVQDSYANGQLTVTDGTNTATLDFNGSYVLANFDFASDGSGGTIVYDPPVQNKETGSGQGDVVKSGFLTAPIVDHFNSSFVFPANFGHAVIADNMLGTESMPHDQAGWATVAAALGVAAHDDGHAFAVIADAFHYTPTPHAHDHGFAI
jgi:serralysin